MSLSETQVVNAVSVQPHSRYKVSNLLQCLSTCKCLPSGTSRKDMPPKKAKGVGTPARQPPPWWKVVETKCDLCHSEIVEGKEDELQCKGTFRMWFHRYCTGVPRSHFKDLTSSEKPFICLLCLQNAHQAVVCQLQADIAALKAQQEDTVHELQKKYANWWP